eukprot:gene21787-27856_t
MGPKPKPGGNKKKDANPENGGELTPEEKAKMFMLTCQSLQIQLSESDVRQDRVLKDKNTIIQMKDDEIAELKAKMDDMAEEFGEMLRETLEKMRERIEISNTNYEGPDLAIQQRMEELKVSD